MAIISNLNLSGPLLTSWELLQSNKTATAGVVVLGFLLWFFSAKNNHLRDIPGPFWGSVTNLYRLIDQASLSSHKNHIALHKKYGRFVRYGPNFVSISDPKGIQDIYGLGTGFYKSEFYPVLQPMNNGKPVATMFHTNSEAVHNSLRHPVAHLFATSTLVGYEPLVDSTIRIFIKRMDEFSLSGEVWDLRLWMQYYAMDVIGELTFSKRLGFLESGTDVEGVLAGIWSFMGYGSVVGQIPWLDKFLNKNPILTVIGKKASGSYIGSFAFNRLQHRLADTSTTKPTNDFLSHYIAVQAEDPENISKEYVLAWTVSNIIAGSDSTAITLCSVFYHLLKNPASLAKLRAELDAAEDAGLISNDEIISWSTSQKLPFLNAAIMEAMRLHPAVGQIFERVTPEGGRKVCGRYFPEGTLVGISPWVVHQDKGVYGEDADVWRPERWIEADEEAMGAMQRTFFVFGSGSRTCVGRNIGRLNTFKLVPQILRDYDIELVEPKKDWTVECSWFAKQSGVMVKTKKRERSRQ